MCSSPDRTSPARARRAASTLSVLVLCLPWAAAAADLPDCDRNADACVRWAVVEVATYVEVCDRLVPDLREKFDAAYAKWPVPTLPIPGLTAALRADSPERSTLRKIIAPYMQKLMPYEREIECYRRWALLQSKPPRLEADHLNLPRAALAPYLK